MTSRSPHLDVYDPKTLAVMDQAFASIWAITHGPVHDYANDCELRIAVGQKLLNLVADGVTDRYAKLLSQGIRQLRKVVAGKSYCYMFTLKGKSVRWGA